MVPTLVNSDAHGRLLGELEAYVAEACADRDASHGLGHMALVTSKSVALMLMVAAQRGAERAVAALTGGDATLALSAEASAAVSVILSAAALATANANVSAAVLADFTSRYLSIAVPEAEADVMPFLNALFAASVDKGSDDKGAAVATASRFTIPLRAASVGTAVCGASENANALVAVWARCLFAYAAAAQIFNDPTDFGLLRAHLRTTADDSASDTDSFSFIPPTAELMNALTALDSLVSSLPPPPSSEQQQQDEELLSAAALPTALARAVAVAMLHDVNDHKYERPDGSLSAGLEAFVASRLCSGGAVDNFASLLFPAAAAEPEMSSPAAQSAVLMAAISAISYSKEKKGGMRYFVATLGPAWTHVRDVCSDADKLEAIGRAGLHRCWHYSREADEQRKTAKAKAEAAANNNNGNDNGNAVDNSVEAILADPARKEAWRAFLFKEVIDHTAEKLAILKDVYMVTAAGKRVAAAEHDAMLALLDEWRATGPPQL